MKPLVECVVNVSEGRRDEVIERIQKELEVGSTRLLHKDVGVDANRTVFTLAGYLEDVFLSIRRLYEFSIQHLDIGSHEGAHPRVGIVDVIPFVPIRGISMTELIAETKAFAKAIANDFDLPIFYYRRLQEDHPDRSLNFYRKKGIAHLQKRMNEYLKPDLGPSTLHERLGASCVTCREYMVAFNINLKTEDLKIAKEIAKRLIEIRTTKKDPSFKHVKFLAWHMPEFNCCQISTNVYDIEAIDLWTLFKKVEQVAAQYDVLLNGSELIGLVPLRAVSRNLEKVEEAFKELNFESVVSFKREERILESVLEKNGFKIQDE